MTAYKKIFLMIILAAVFVLGGCNSQAATLTQAPVDGNLKIHMLDIGQGDALLIQTGEQTILIDTGRIDTQAQFVKELEKFSVTRVDKLILTHAHADHTGGAILLLNPNEKQLTDYPYLKKISVGAVYDNGIAYASSAYKNYIKATKQKKIPYKSLKIGDTLDFGGGVQFKVLFPTADFVTAVNSNNFDKDKGEYSTNNGSIVGKLTYKKFSMMFTGDSEKESEAKIVAQNNAKDLHCDVLKAGHHGWDTSSTKDFVAAIKPSVVVISVGHKDLNHVVRGAPPVKTLENYFSQGVQAKNIYATRINDTITIVSDGKNFSVQPEVKKDWVNDWIAKKKSYQKKK